MASEIKFFDPTDPININTLLELTEDEDPKWELQTAAPEATSDRSQGLARNGDEAAWRAYNSRATNTATYKCYAATGMLKVPRTGVVASGWHIDTAKVDWDPVGWPTLTVTMHKHTGATNHAENSCNTFASSIALPAGMCIPETLTDGAVSEPVIFFDLGTSAVGLRSMSYTLACTHVDETGRDGDWLAGENRDGSETLEIEFTGQPDDADLTIHSSFHKGGDGKPEGNTQANTRRLSLVRHIPREVPAE